MKTDGLKLRVWYVFPDTSQNPETVEQFDECMRRLVIQKYFPRLDVTVLTPEDSLSKFLNQKYQFRFLPLASVSNDAAKMYVFL